MWTFIVIALVCLGLPAATFIAGVMTFPAFKVAFNPVVHTIGIDWTNKQAVLDAVSRSFTTAPGNYVRALLSPALPKLSIDIKFKHFETIRKKREEALRVGYLDASSDDLVPARIRVDGRTIKVKLRLKGDLLDHLKTDKWSFRVQTKRSDHLFGMRRFSIQAPETRKSHLEPLFLAHMRKEGVLVPRYRFVSVVLNGDDLGTMALEESFSKELLESQRRREGVIVKFDGDAWWRFRTAYGYPGPYGEYVNTPIMPFAKKRTFKSPALSRDYHTAVGILRGYLGGQLPVSQALNIRLLARYLIIQTIWGTTHPMILDNVRLYLNPVSLKLEPIAYDGQPLLSFFDVKALPIAWTLFYQAFDDPAFRRMFLEEARRIAADVQSDTFGRWFDDQENLYSKALHKQNPFVPTGLWEILKKRASTMSRFKEANLIGTVRETRSFLTHRDKGQSGKFEYSAPINAFIVKGDDGSVLELQNLIPEALSIDAIVATEEGSSLKLETLDTRAVSFPLRLPPRTTERASSVFYKILSEQSLDERTLKIKVRRNDRPETYTVRAAPYSLPRAEAAHFSEARDWKAALPRFAKWDENSNQVHVGPGEWTLKKNLVLPKGVSLSIASGATLRLSPDVFILVRGKIDIRGTAANPVRLTNLPDMPAWGGLAVLSDGHQSTIKHASFEGAKGIANSQWATTGAVTFYKSNVHIEHTNFENIDAEDALNYIETEFLLRDATFRRTRSDALDADFSTGKISDSRFDFIGGDGIDVSGSIISVHDVDIRNTHDKAVSVGEQSTLTAKTLMIRDAGTGIVSKDGSKTAVEDVNFNNIRYYPLMAYIKKPEYGPAELSVTSVKSDTDRKLAIAQSGSKIEIDGNRVATEEIDISTLYKQGYMNKNAR